MKKLIMSAIVPLVLVSGVTWKLMQVSKTRHPVKDIQRIERIDHALHEFFAVSNRYPEALPDLLDFKPTKLFLPSSDTAFRDTWGHDLVYESSGTNYVLLSVGKDGIRGTADDLSKQW